MGEVMLNATGSERAQELGADFKIASCLRMILLTIPLVAQALLAYYINIYPGKYCGALQNARVSAVSSAAALALPPRGTRVEDEDEAERQAREDARANLETAIAVIDAVISEVESSAENEPMRVLFFKAEPAVVSMFVAAVWGILAIQLNGLRAVVI
eukprot:Tamp_12092.p3 GENE.Tamp_12092~~Tamp_12092.p3  ORF type:complete len:157 (-),score=29.52 Tamp_12092:226-696(-)